VTGDTAYEGYKAWLRAKEMAPDAIGSVVGLTCVRLRSSSPARVALVCGPTRTELLDVGRVCADLLLSPAAAPSAPSSRRRPRCCSPRSRSTRSSSTRRSRSSGGACRTSGSGSGSLPRSGASSLPLPPSSPSSLSRTQTLTPRRPPCSLGFIPFLPALFDEPVEGYVDATFDRLERKLYPDETSPVRRALEAGKHHTQELHAQAEKEKAE